MLVDTGSEGWVVAATKTLQKYMGYLDRAGLAEHVASLPKSNTVYEFGAGDKSCEKTLMLPVFLSDTQATESATFL